MITFDVCIMGLTDISFSRALAVGYLVASKSIVLFVSTLVIICLRGN